MLRPLLLVALLAAPAWAQAPDPDEVRRIEAGLAEQRASGEKLRRAQQLDEELAALGQAPQDWVQCALLLVELGDMKDRRAVPFLVARLTDPRPVVVAFALHGLVRTPVEQLRQAGRGGVVAGLIEALERGDYHRRVARQLLTQVVGDDLGASARPWKRWLEKHGPELALEPLPQDWDESLHDPALVAKVRARVGADATVAPRIPSVLTQLRDLNKRGLDVALCLDQTHSMGPVIAEAKERLERLTALVGRVCKDTRWGLVTYDDAVQIDLPLASSGNRLREMLSRVELTPGEDIPEGVDKALEAAAKFSWRRKAAKVVILVGDAPPHAEDVQRTLVNARELKENLDLTTDTVSTGSAVEPTLARIAEAGGGRALLLRDPARLLSEVLLLVFGEGLRPSMERFVPIFLEIEAEAR
jgi:hypothetical protein